MNQLQKLALKFILPTIGLGILIQILLPFPYNIMVTLVSMLFMPLVFGYVVRKKFGNIGINFTKERIIEKTCSVCGNKTKEGQCPRCGSKQFRYI